MEIVEPAEVVEVTVFRFVLGFSIATVRIATLRITTISITIQNTTPVVNETQLRVSLC